MAGSGYASYENAHDPSLDEPYQVIRRVLLAEAQRQRLHSAFGWV